MTHARGTSNSNSRGSAEQRRVRKTWLLTTFGNGKRARCATCPAWLTFETITVDRWPIPGCEGGTYRRGNIRPMCGTCNSRDGQRLAQARIRAGVAELWRYAIPVTLRAGV